MQLIKCERGFLGGLPYALIIQGHKDKQALRNLVKQEYPEQHVENVLYEYGTFDGASWTLDVTPETKDSMAITVFYWDGKGPGLYS